MTNSHGWFVQAALWALFAAPGCVAADVPSLACLALFLAVSYAYLGWTAWQGEQRIARQERRVEEAEAAFREAVRRAREERQV